MSPLTQLYDVSSPPALTQARRAPYLGTAPPVEATPGPGASASRPRHGAPRAHTTRRQSARQMARGPGAYATTCTRAAAGTLRRPGGRRDARLTAAGGLGQNRA